MLDVEAARTFGNVIEVAVGVGLVEVERRVDDSVAHGEKCCSDSGGSARTLRMSDQALETRAGQFCGVLAESEFDGSGFDAVVQFGGRSVVLEVVDVFGTDAGFVESHADGACGL